MKVAYARSQAQADAAEAQMHEAEHRYFDILREPSLRAKAAPQVRAAAAEWMRLRANVFAHAVTQHLVTHMVKRAAQGERWSLGNREKQMFLREARNLYRPVLETQYMFRGDSEAEQDVRARRLREARKPLLAWLNHLGLGVTMEELAQW